MDENIKSNLKETATWLRGIYMILFMIIYWVAEVIIGVVIFFQFLSVLITSSKNERLLALGQSLSTYIYQIMAYLSFNTEARPYPIADWPAGTPAENVLPEPTVTETKPEAKVEEAKPDDAKSEDKAEDEKPA